MDFMLLSTGDDYEITPFACGQGDCKGCRGYCKGCDSGCQGCTGSVIFG